MTVLLTVYLSFIDHLLRICSFQVSPIARENERQTDDVDPDCRGVIPVIKSEACPLLSKIFNNHHAAMSKMCETTSSQLLWNEFGEWSMVHGLGLTFGYLYVVSNCNQYFFTDLGVQKVDSTLMISQWNIGNPTSFMATLWTFMDILVGYPFLHFGRSSPLPISTGWDGGFRHGQVTLDPADHRSRSKLTWRKLQPFLGDAIFGGTWWKLIGVAMSYAKFWFLRV